jgi:hypothetical protein
MSDAPPRAEHARPPGWMPPVHPSPAPVATAPAAPRRVQPLSVRPPRPAPPAAAPKRPGGFPMLALLLAFQIINPVSDLFSAEVPAGLVESVTRMVEVGSLAFKAALVVGMLRFEWWVGRAAVFWGASLVVLRLLGQLESATYYSGPGPFLGELILSLILPAIVVIYVWDGSRGLAPPPSP